MNKLLKSVLTPGTFLALLFSSSLTLAEALWIDVRSADEYAQDHIEGDLNIHFQSIGNEIGKHAKDKNTEIHVYCQVGGRAGVALLQLTAMGYQNVTNEGGIADARKKRNIVVTK